MATSDRLKTAEQCEAEERRDLARDAEHERAGTSTIRLILWAVTHRISRRGIWEKDRTILDVMEPDPAYLEATLDGYRDLIRENGRIHQRMFPGVDVEVTEEEVS